MSVPIKLYRIEHISSKQVYVNCPGRDPWDAVKRAAVVHGFIADVSSGFIVELM